MIFPRLVERLSAVCCKISNFVGQQVFEFVIKPLQVFLYRGAVVYIFDTQLNVIQFTTPCIMPTASVAHSRRSLSKRRFRCFLFACAQLNAPLDVEVPSLFVYQPVGLTDPYSFSTNSRASLKFPAINWAIARSPYS